MPDRLTDIRSSVEVNLSTQHNLKVGPGKKFFFSYTYIYDPIQPHKMNRKSSALLLDC